jgi:hypothetical protein
MLSGMSQVIAQPRNLVSFTVIFGISQNLGGLAGSALIGSFQTWREKLHSSQLTEGLSLLDPLVAVRVQADRAAAPREQALHAYEQAARNAFAEVDNALQAIASLRVQHEQALLRRDAALQTLRIARYRNGYASYLEELDAQHSTATPPDRICCNCAARCWRRTWVRAGAGRRLEQHRGDTGFRIAQGCCGAAVTFCAGIRFLCAAHAFAPLQGDLIS